MAELNEGHRQRLKERFLKEGLAHFAPHNILELLLFYAVPRKDTNQLAHALLETFGSLSGVLDASYDDLQKVRGMGPHSASLLKFCGSLVPAYLEDVAATGTVLNTTKKVCQHLVPKFLGMGREMVYLLCLDSKKKLLYSGPLHEGGLDSVRVESRSIVEKALAVRAAAVILAHNHPGGFAVPSSEDIRVTQNIFQTLQPLSIQLLDHFIVAGDGCVSMAESGILFNL